MGTPIWIKFILWNNQQTSSIKMLVQIAIKNPITSKEIHLIDTKTRVIVMDAHRIQPLGVEDHQSNVQLLYAYLVVIH
jgi:hypothetical protein